MGSASPRSWTISSRPAGAVRDARSHGRKQVRDAVLSGDYLGVLVGARERAAERATGGAQWPELPGNTRKLRKTWFRLLELHVANL